MKKVLLPYAVLGLLFLFAAAVTFANGAKQHDDMTMIVVKVL